MKTLFILLSAYLLIGCSTSENKYQKAKEFFTQGEIAQSEEILYNLLKTSPPNYDYLFLLGRCQQKDFEDKKALQTFNSALKLRTQRDSLHFFMGESYQLEGKYDSAIVFYSRFMNEHNQSYEILRRLGLCSRLIKNYPDALNYFSHSLMMNPEYYLTYANMGVYFNDIHEYRKAINNFSIALLKNVKDEDRENVEIYRRISHAYFYLGKQDSAMIMLKNAVKKYDYDLDKVFIDIAGLYTFELNEPDSAEFYYNKAKDEIEENYRLYEFDNDTQTSDTDNY